MSGLPTANPSGALAVGTNVVVIGKFTLNSLQLLSDGTNACTATVYDNTAASGKIVAIATIPATTVPPQNLVFSRAIKCEIGITVVVAGTGAQAFVSTGAT